MRTEDGPEKIVRRREVRHPVAHRFIDRILERPATGIHSDHFGAKKPHPKHIQALPLHVLGAHIYGAFESETRCNGRRCNSMLPGACLCDHAAFPHAHREQALAYTVVDLMRARVEQIFTLQVNRVARLDAR